jgi:hypothetical protein
LPCALAFFHRAFAIADSLALPAALIFRFGFVADLLPLIFAHLALAPAAIAARPARLIRRFFGV